MTPRTQTQRNIDLGLAVIASVSPPGKKWTLADIAEVCGCSVKTVFDIEQRALAKMKREAEKSNSQDVLKCAIGLK